MLVTTLAKRASFALSVVLAAGALAGVVTAPHPAAALPDGLALTPPMGFNNWNSFGCNVDEKLIRETADLFVCSGMKASRLHLRQHR